MRNLLVISAALVVVLGIVSANLWRELRADRELIVDLQEQLAAAELSAAEAERARASQAAIAAQMAAAAARPAAAAVAPVPPPPPTPVMAPVITTGLPATPVVVPSVRMPPTSGSYEERRASMLAQAEQTATSRVLAWRDRLALNGQTLSSEQLQALNTAAVAELKRETEESIEIDSRTGPVDPQTLARLREETITRQHETNLRILERMNPHLSVEQSNALRTMFEAWVGPRLAAARAASERLATQ